MPFRLHQDADGNTVFQEDASGQATGEFIIRFADGREIGFGAGQTDTDQTYIRLKNDDGDDAYIDINTATVAGSTTRP